jgi:hypothetical protein
MINQARDQRIVGGSIAVFLLVLFIAFEDGGDIFFPDVGLTLNYRALRLKGCSVYSHCRKTLITTSYF